jgi:hypothetical protein
MELLRMYIDKHSDTPRNEIDMILETIIFSSSGRGLSYYAKEQGPTVNIYSGVRPGLADHSTSFASSILTTTFTHQQCRTDPQSLSISQTGRSSRRNYFHFSTNTDQNPLTGAHTAPQSLCGSLASWRAFTSSSAYTSPVCSRYVSLLCND